MTGNLGLAVPHQEVITYQPVGWDGEKETVSNKHAKF